MASATDSRLHVGLRSRLAPGRVEAPGIEGYSGHIVEVTSATTKRASTKVVRFHQRLSLPAADVMRVGTIPTTTPTRSLLDVGAVISQKGLEEALDSALRQRLTSVDRLRAGVQ